MKLWHSIAARRQRVTSGPLARTDHTAPSTNRDAGTVTQRTTERADIFEHVASVQAIPRSILPDGPARVQLVALAANGYGVQAYDTHGVTQRWYLWLQGLADARPSTGRGRITVEQWRDHYEAITALIVADGPDPVEVWA